MNKWKSESVARPQAHPKQNESFFIILIGLGQNIIIMYPVHKYLTEGQLEFNNDFQEIINTIVINTDKVQYHST